MEQLINNDEILKLINSNETKINESCSNELKILEHKYLLDKQRMMEENDLNINNMKERIKETYDTLKNGYDEYLKDNDKNTIFINNGHCIIRYHPRELHEWIEDNQYEMNIVNLFLTKLPSNIKYDLSSTSYTGDDQIERYFYDHGKDSKLIITFTKSD